MTALSPNDRVTIIGQHPHKGTAGTLVSFGPYGPSVFGWTGWLVKLDDGGSCYANAKQVRRAS